MKREIRITEDGSHTLYLPEMDENYHSIHGAIQESKHVFIEAGLKYMNKNQINILEIGLGTGLNTLLSAIQALNSGINISYYGIEKYPLTPDEYQALNYSVLTGENMESTFLAIHQCEWEKPNQLTTNFQLTKLLTDITTCSFDKLPFFDLIYFDAFAPNKQTGVWDIEIFRKIQAHCNPQAVFVTYCAKGSVRRNLQQVGFKVERIQGPPGKKEMLRGIK